MLPEQKDDAVFDLHGVSKRFGDVQALRPLNLTVQSGRTTVLIGPSGCGKSTLLRLMVGLIQADEGSIRFENRKLTPESALTLRQGMGYVIQDGGLFPHLSAGDNVTLMARYLGWVPQRINARLTELVELSRFPGDGLKRYPVQLSGGQRQRVSLMRALMLDPDVLLLDEPLGALDPMIRADLQTDLRRVFRTVGKSVVLVTHDLSEAGYLGDVMVLMREGRIVQQGLLSSLFQSPADPFVTRFVRAQRTAWECMEGRSS